MIKPLALRTLSVLTLLFMASSVSIEQVRSAPSFLTAIQFKLPPVPSRGAPGRRGEGASRGDCIRSAQPFTAIVPSIQSNNKTDVWGLTTAEHPTLFAYIPFAQKCTTIEFIVQDDAGKLVYRMPVTTSNKPSMVSIRIPATAPKLKPNALYHWFLQATITPKPIESEGSRQAPDVYSVDGWIQRVSLTPALSQQLKQASLQQQVRLYAENGIWFDALGVLAELRLANPKDAALAKDWEQLLQSVKLETFKAEPIVATKSSQAKSTF
jgi:hypothetical protein